MTTLWEELDPLDPAHAWCAGLYEGEGSMASYLRTTSSKWRPQPTIRLGIDMTDLEPLETFEDIMQLGKIYGPYHRNNKIAKPMYRYHTDVLSEITTILGRISWWLSPRRKEQATLIVSRYLNWREEFPYLNDRKDRRV